MVRSLHFEVFAALRGSNTRSAVARQILWVSCNCSVKVQSTEGLEMGVIQAKPGAKAANEGAPAGAKRQLRKGTRCTGRLYAESVQLQEAGKLHMYLFAT